MRASFERTWLPAISLTVILALGSAAPAAARSRTTAPSGNSAISQYLETIPSVTGNRPTDTLHKRPGGSHSSVGLAGRGGGGGSGGVSASTARALDASGPAGVAAANVALATEPRSSRSPGAKSGANGVARGERSIAGASTAPAQSLLDALTGSSTGGLGALLPALLILTVVGGGLLALVRRRRSRRPDA